MPKKISILAPEIALLSLQRSATTAWMMIKTVQQTVQTVTVQPQLPASAASKTPHVRLTVNVAPMFVKMAGVLLD